MKSKFISFLKEHKAYTAFVRNYKLCPDWHAYSLKEYYQIISPAWYLSHSFKWSATCEGEKYWYDLALKWSDTLKPHDN